MLKSEVLPRATHSGPVQVSARPLEMFDLLTVAVGLRLILPSAAEYFVAPHRAEVYGASYVRTDLSQALGWVTTLLVLFVSLLCIATPQKTRRPVDAPLLIAVLAPLVLYTVWENATSAAGSWMINSLICGLVLIAIWRAAPTIQAVRRIGLAAGFVCALSLLLLALEPNNAYFVDIYGTVSSSAKVLIGDHQLAGIVGHSNTLGMISVTAIALLIGQKVTLLRLILVLSAVSCLVLSASRTSMIAGVLLCITAVGSRVLRLRGRRFDAVALMLFLPVLLVPLLADSPDSFTNRGRIWEYSLSEFVESPVFGNGPDWYRDVALTSQAMGPEAASGHNLLVHVLATLGLLGLAVFGMLFFVMISRSLKSKFPADRALARRVLTVIFAFAMLEYCWAFDVGSDVFMISYYLVAALALHSDFGLRLDRSSDDLKWTPTVAGSSRNL